MPEGLKTGINIYQFESFQKAGLVHGVFLRHGGVSRGHCSSLNMGLTVGDDPQHVAENRARAFAHLNRPLNSLSDSWLVHGHGVFEYQKPLAALGTSLPKVDILLTDNPEVSLFMRFADCVPILLYDPRHRAICLAHAGWEGTVQMVAQQAVLAMQQTYLSKPEDLLAAIGPSIGPEEYEVGENVIVAVRQAFGAEAKKLLPGFGPQVHFDLWAANALSLKNAGVRHIELSGISTAANTKNWFSHRAEGGKTGRFGVIFALPA